MEFADMWVPFWNRKVLDPPTQVSLKIKSENPGLTSAKLASDLNDVISVLENQNLLHYDAAIISRLLYRTKKTLRNDKGYKGFQKINRILKNYLSLNLIKIVSDIRCASYDGKGPSKEMLEWCLINLLRFAALFHRLEKTCVETGYYMHNHITTGNRWHLALMFLACLSRVWTLSRYLLILNCEWYSRLKNYLNCLESEHQWLPSDYKLPDSLKSWLGNPDYLCKSNENDASITKLSTPKTSGTSTVLGGLLFNEDFGEVVCRGDNSALSSDQGTSDKIETPRDIEKFIRDEEVCRKRRKKSISSNLNESDWNHLKYYLKKSLNDMKTSRNKNTFCESMNRARQKIKAWLQQDV